MILGLFMAEKRYAAADGDTGMFYTDALVGWQQYVGKILGSLAHKAHQKVIDVRNGAFVKALDMKGNGRGNR